VCIGSGIPDAVYDQISHKVIEGQTKNAILLNIWANSNSVADASTLRSLSKDNMKNRVSAFLNNDWQSSAYTGVHIKDFFSQVHTYPIRLH
jgi:hypothetical protein